MRLWLKTVGPDGVLYEISSGCAVYPLKLVILFSLIF